MIDSMVLRTPLIAYRGGSREGTHRLYLKPENLQPFGSYKIRGVLAAVRAARPEVLAKGLAAASAGNMAQAVAFVAQSLNLKCRIYVPETAPLVKKEAIRRLGATLIERPYGEIWQMVRGKAFQDETDGLFIHPIFTPGLLAGYGTIAAELLADRPHLGAVVIPFGVGGLSLGVARALAILKPQMLIYTCEPETAAPLHLSLQAGRAMATNRQPSFVDAIGTPEVLPEVFAEIVGRVQESLVVTLAEVRQAIADLAVHAKLICEGAGAASLAAGLKVAAKHPDRDVACILSGGNLPLEVLMECLREGI